MLLWMMMIFAASSLSSDAIESTGAGRASRSAPAVVNQVVAHLIEFGVLSLLLFRALALQSTVAVLRLWLVVVAATTAYGATDEFHQSVRAGPIPELARHRVRCRRRRHRLVGRTRLGMAPSPRSAAR
ncbi:MAG: VanZ family protein [Chloroflexi bacterium]|nr:VanZ family protein [Chloroflexota bacterium]